MAAPATPGIATGRVAAVVLAAGASSRMGRSKPLLRIGERTYLECVLRTLETTAVDPVVAVLGHEADAVVAGTRWGRSRSIFAEDWREGMLRSLQAGLRELMRLESGGGVPYTAVLVALVDTPRIAAATVTAVLAGHRPGEVPVVLPVHDGRHGHPVLFDRALWSELMTADVARGPRAVVEAHRDDAVLVAVDDPWILRDADTPAEHRRMLETG